MEKNEEQIPREDAGDSERLVVPVIEEQVVAGAQPVKTGSVRVDKHVEKRMRKIEVPLLHEEVEVRRVPMNQVIDQIPAIRKKGEVVIVPVVEEELVVTRRLVLKEEIHLIRRRTKDREVREVELNREHAEVHRLDANGRVVDRPSARPASARPPLRRRGILE